jgi:amino acid adenylation domain-containing protein/FkbM family methyltransferase
MSTVRIEGFQLSPQQEHLWLLHQQGGGPAYRAQCAISIEGELDKNRLRDAIDAVMQRHEILRTTFRNLPEMTLPLQVIGEGEIGWDEEDLSHLADDEQAACIDEIFRQLGKQTFDFENEKLVQASLLKLNAESHVLFLSMPSLCMDAAGLKNVVAEVARSYMGDQIAADGPLQYADIAELLNEIIEAEESAPGREFWQQQDIFSVHMPALSFERPATTEQNFTPEVVSLPLEQERVRHLADELGTTVETLLLGCWYALLWRYAKQEQMIVGVEFSLRKYGSVQEALGLFAKHLPLRCRVDGQRRFSELVDQVETAAKEAYKWQESFSWEQFGEGTYPHHAPYAFAFSEQSASYSTPKVSFSISREFVCHDRFKLKLCGVSRGNSLAIEVHYDSNLFDEDDAKRLAAQFRQLLTSVLERPDAAVAELDILDDHARRQVLYDFNQTRVEFSAPNLIHKLVEARAERTPEAIAVVAGAEQLSYREYNERANRLAHFLIGEGVGSGTPVGISVERSWEMIVGLLGILKAGGAYLPLDASLPQRRLEMMLADARPRLILTQQHLRESLPATEDNLFYLDRDWSRVASESPANPSQAVSDQNPAYIIYTSGSTGIPKGVVISHRAICNRLLWLQAEYPLTTEDRLLQKTVFSFDASVWEIFVPLLAGAKLVLAQVGEEKDASYLVRAVAEQQVTVLQVVPSMLALILEEQGVEELNSLRRVFSGGEALPVAVASRFYTRLDAQLVNLYGPTESSIDATHFACTSEALDQLTGRATVAIGKPIANVYVYVLDDRGQPVPPGVAGELHIGGIGLAHGYLNRPDLTAEKFVPDPFSLEPGARIYRTGDLARYTPQGDVEFLGRLDHQVKIRGYRIELGEIEAVLRRHPQVRSGMVIVREDESGEPRLVGYVVPQQGADVLDRRLYRLPNNLQVAHLNRNETEVLYKEIFEDESYLRHGIKLSDESCVFDVGANIGMFSLFVQQRWPHAQVHAFEPIPTTYKVLETNIQLHGLNVRPYNCGLSERSGTATFTFYPQMSAMSGMYTDAQEDESLTRAYMANQDAQLGAVADELLQGRFASENFVCPLKTISEVIHENNIERIDLLKVDVEKSELNVLSGIADEDWPRIRQLVIEVHDENGRLREITDLLQRHGFNVICEQDSLLAHTSLYNLYAVHPSRVEASNGDRHGTIKTSVEQSPAESILSVSALRRYFKENLPEYMIPATFVMLKAMPLLPNGKVDINSLPAPDAIRPDLEEEFAAPRTPIEEVLAGIWSQVLGIERIGIKDSFFDLGGHSLLVMQVISRVRRVFNVNLPLRSMFEAPTVAGFAEKVEEALRQSEDLQIPPITPVPRDKPLPLSFAQQRLWFLQQLDTASTVYNLPHAIRLSGSLNVTALRQTLDEIVRRHENLRTTFDMVDGQPIQVIKPAEPVDMPVTDLSHLPSDERESKVRQLATDEALTPFDLSTGPLLRVSLLRLSPDEHVALLTMHHIISDGWSFGVFIREIAALYGSFLNNQTMPLTDLPIQYADYAVWQREWLSGENLELQLAYWKSQLSGELPIIELPLDHPRPAVQTFNGEALTTSFPRELTGALKALSREEGVTLFMAGLAIFQTLLHRYSGQTDILVGSPIAGRQQAETEALIGFFVNTLVFRTDLSGDPTFRELLQRVREVALGAYTHQDLPFEKLVEELQPARDLSRSPLFQVMFAIQNAPASPPDLSGISVSFLDAGGVPAKFDLSMTMTDTGSDLINTINYNTDLFDYSTITRLFDHLHNLVESIVRQPDRRLSEFNLLAEAEQQQVVVEWNQTAVVYGTPRALHEFVESQVARTPEATALVFEDEEVSYGELNERANKVARHLQSLGIGPDVIVGVCMERSVELVVGLLGILKAGGAYLPLDPAYPSERLQFMLADARPPVLLTQEPLLTTLPVHEAQVVCLDAPEWKTPLAWDAQNPTIEVSDQNLNYVIYTSGSTGRPKGAMNTHGAIVNRLLWMQDAYGLTPADRVLQKTPYSFDVSVWEFFWPLMTGARLVVASPGGHQDATYLADLITRQQITTVHFVPSMLQIFIDSLEAGSCASLKRVICSGEALSLELQERFHARLPAELHNLYGPTEAAVDVTAWACERGAQRYSVPIGRPIANTTIYILDSKLRPVAVGMAGELHIGGVGLARGYLNHPELTAERFIPDPFSTTPGARLYKTGDLARYLANGEIEYLGRLDFQVKVRGLRIELEEIEAVLTEHEAVREAVVVAREDKPGDVRLVAYLVCRDELSVTSGELRLHAGQKLPDYMVPSAFVMLDELPLSPNGKLDRRALPEPEWSSPDAKSYIAPRTTTEEIVAGIWMEVLGAKQVSVHDNFFEIGGHSLLATQVISRVRQTFHVELLLRKVFEKPTVEGLAEIIDAMVQEKQGVSLAPPLRPAERASGIPLSFAQQRLWFLNQMEPDSPFYNITVAVRIDGPLNTGALEKTFQEIVHRHETLRTTFSSINGEPVQVIAPDVKLEMPLVHLEQLPQDQRDDRVELFILEETRQKFDLETGPLFRVTLLKLEEESHVVIVALHHIVSDGWSLGLLIGEVGSLYEPHVKGEPSPLPDLPVQYADFAHWQRAWLDGQGIETHLEYWRKQLAGAPPLLELPTDYPRPVVPTRRGAHASLTVGGDVAEPLRLLGRAEGATLFMTLLAAFDILLARYTTQTDIVVGTPIANRNRVELEKLIGMFANTLVLRADLSGNLTFRELLRRVRDLALEAYAHQDLPFEQLVQELAPERELSHTPLFQVMFGVQNVAVPRVASPEISLTPLTVESGIAKFDISLFMFEGGADLQGRIEYSTDLFSSDIIARMMGHFQQLLASIAANPDQRINDLPMLLADERHMLLDEWNDTEVTDQRGLSIWQALRPRFETIPPDATAVAFYGETLTYAELNERANRLANRLRRLGVGPDSLVAICMERSPEMIVALLAAIKADGAYVPLDASYPAERLAVMLDDARPLVLVTQKHLAETLPPHDSKLVLVDAESDSIAGESPEAPISQATGDNLGYVIYTSGSTGKPKGIAMRQGVLANLMMWEARGTAAGPRRLQFASVSFDVSFQEIFTTLYCGGAVVLISQEDRLDPHALLRVITEQQVDRTILPVVALQQLAEIVEETGVMPVSLRDIGTAGDRLQITKPITDWLGKLGCIMRNQYGPSENHCMMELILDADVSSWPSLPSLGRPIDNTRIYVLDRGLNPVPVGVTGELYIGGECLSRGYLNKPDLTAERYVPDLYGHEPGARLYKSGDLVRFLPNGNVEFVGRNDFQVKLRGFRIELGEIEAVLSEHPAVQGVVAIVDKDSNGQKRLLAYAVTDGKVESAELRSFLKERLPDYMVPSIIVLLDQFPLSPNGKVNRQALPAPDPTRSDEETYVEPRTPVEEVVAGIFAHVIGVERVGSIDNFFDLGGHSLLATLVMSRIRQAFNVDLPLRRIFEEPTVAGLAGVVETERFASDKPRVPAIARVARGEEIPLAYLQERFWRIAQNRPATFYHFETELNGAIDVAILERVLNEIVRRQEILRTTFTESSSKIIQVVHDYEPLSLPFVDVGHLPYEERRMEVTRLSAEQTAPPFDLAVGPPFRVSLVRLSDEEHFLLFTLTHIIADHWSLKVLGDEVLKLYDAYSKGLESPLPELPIQYADFAYWQRSWMQGEVLRDHLDYWREHLAGAPLLLELPTDFARPPVQTYNGGNISVPVDEAVVVQLKKLTREAGVTLFMTTLTAYKILLARYSGQENIVTATATSGRKQVVTEDLIGVFVNMVVMHTDLTGDPTFLQMLARVREVVLGAYAHEDTPFDTLVQELRPVPDPSHSPLAQVGFVLHSVNDTAAPTTLRMKPMPTYSTRSQYDLTLRIMETPYWVTVHLEYNSDLFKEDTVNRILEDYRLLLQQIVTNPEMRLSEFQLSPLSNRHHTAAS